MSDTVKVNGGTMTRDDIKRIREAYDEAVKQGVDQFEVQLRREDGNGVFYPTIELATRYAKYLLEYAEPIFKSRD